jgi:hypothetical protein
MILLLDNAVLEPAAEAIELPQNNRPDSPVEDVALELP